MHRDIKPDNILLNSKDENILDIRLGDLGLATPIPKEEQSFQKCGTPGYIGPEVLKGAGYNQQCDLFSLGVVMYNMLTGKPLFCGKDQEEVLKNNYFLKVNKFKDKIASYSEPAKDLLVKLLIRDPSKRLTAKTAAIHPFFGEDRLAV